MNIASAVNFLLATLNIAQTIYWLVNGNTFWWIQLIAVLVGFGLGLSCLGK